MCVMCWRLIQRFDTNSYVVGFCTGVVLSILVYQPSLSRTNEPYTPTTVSDGRWNKSWDRSKEKGNWSRHLYLIRHGQYFDKARRLRDMHLTDLGKQQLVFTGRRLAAMNITFDRLVHSGMVRAVESAQILNRQLTDPLPLIEDKDLMEGLPVVPSPYANITQKQVDASGSKERIDRAFQTYFRRADQTQSKDTHDILVFHANVLRYFVCKVMQFPVEFWLNLGLRHGSITQLTIHKKGSTRPPLELSTDFLYNGPLLVEPYELPEPDLAPNPHIKFQMTSPTDTIAIKLGQLFMKADDQRKLHLSEGIDAIREIEKQDALRALEELKQNIQVHEEGAREMYERSQAMKQLLSKNQQEFNKRFKGGNAEE